MSTSTSLVAPSRDAPSRIRPRRGTGYTQTNEIPCPADRERNWRGGDAGMVAFVAFQVPDDVRERAVPSPTRRRRRRPCASSPARLSTRGSAGKRPRSRRIRSVYRTVHDSGTDVLPRTYAAATPNLSP